MANLYKGVNIVEGQGLSAISGRSQTVTGIMGTFYKGPLNKATLVTNMAQFERTFGNKPLTGITSYYDVKGFFANVGEAALAIVNVKGPAAAKATKTLQDIHGTPKDTIKISALSEGDHGERLTVDVLDDNILVTGIPSGTVASGAVTATLKSTTGLEIGSIVKFDNGTNNEKVLLTSINKQTNQVGWSGGLTNSYEFSVSTVKSIEFKVIVYENANEVERWTGLSINEDVTFHCEKLINNHSLYITIEDLDSVSAPLATQMPAQTTSSQALTGGDDDLDGLQESHWSGSAGSGTGIYAFSGVNGLFRVACINPMINTGPEAGYLVVVQNLLNFANAQQDVQVYAEVPYNKSQADAVIFAAKFEGRRLCIWYPWIKVVESGSVIWISPVGSVLGTAARKDAERGIYKNVGNEPVAYGSDIERYSTRTEEETLNEGGVNTIVVRSGLKTWGGRTRSASTNFRFINYSELFNDISRTLKGEVGDVSFEPNNSVTRAKLTRRITAYLNSKILEGGIVAFATRCDDTNNPGDQVAIGILNCEIEYQPAGVAEKIVFTVTSSPAGITVAEAA